MTLASATGESVNIIYSTTPEGSPARQLVVDLHVIYGIPTWIDKDPAKASHVQFLTDLTRVFLKCNVGHTPARVGAAKHHRLADGCTEDYHKLMGGKKGGGSGRS
jgi:hypothetical protein